MRGIPITPDLLEFFNDTTRSWTGIHDASRKELRGRHVMSGREMRSFYKTRLTPWLPATLGSGSIRGGLNVPLLERVGEREVSSLGYCGEEVAQRIHGFLCRNWHLFREENGSAMMSLPKRSWFRVGFNEQLWFVQSVASCANRDGGRTASMHQGHRIHKGSYARGERRHPLIEQDKVAGPSAWSVICSGEGASPKWLSVPDDAVVEPHDDVTLGQLREVDERNTRHVLGLAASPTQIEVLGLSA